MKLKYRFIIAALMVTLLAHPAGVSSQDVVERSGPSGVKIEQAVMCESIEAFVPKNPAVIFSLSIGEVLCYSLFDSVPREMSIYHRWYRRDQLSTSRKLMLKPPTWSTFSRIQFREGDKGPWRVDITDENGHVLRTLRFSVTD